MIKNIIDDWFKGLNVNQLKNDRIMYSLFLKNLFLEVDKYSEITKCEKHIFYEEIGKKLYKNS